MNPFLLLLLSHILGDGVFNSSRLARLKRRSHPGLQTLALASHTAVHALIAGLLLFAAQGAWLWGAFLVFAAHFLIDFTRCRMEFSIFGPEGLVLTRMEALAWIRCGGRDLPLLDKKDFRPWLFLNLGDQGAHLVSLYLIGLVIA
jgi:hypothetical protein